MNQEFKTNFNFVFNIIILILLVVGGFSWADSNGLWTQARDILPGTFGADEGGGDYVFPNNLDVNGALNLTGDNVEDVNILRGNSVDLDGTSYIGQIVSKKYFSPDSTDYHLDPSDVSRINRLFTNGTISVTSRYIRMDEGGDNDWGFISEAGQDGIGLLGNIVRYPTMDLYVEHDGEVKINNNILNLTENNIENVNILKGNRVKLDGGTSNIDEVASNAYYSLGSRNFYLKPSGDSKINSLDVSDELCLGEECYDNWDNVAKSNQMCEDGKAVVGIDINGDIVCDWPNSVYR